jgi:hypothetical protein
VTEEKRNRMVERERRGPKKKIEKVNRGEYSTREGKAD